MNNFVIVGTQRTGSTALFRALNFHPDIACGSEWTLGIPAHRKIYVAERGFAGDFTVLPPRERKRIDEVFGPDKKWLGFKLLFRSSAKWIGHPRLAPALWFDRLEKFLRWFAAKPSIYVIHIVRNDPVEWLKSKYVSDQVRAWAGRPYPTDVSVRIPAGEAIKRLAAKSWIDCRLASLAGTNPYFRLSYENFLESNHAVIDSTMRFLRCDPALLGAFDYRTQTKQSHRPASEYISNYHELVGALRDNGLSGPRRT